MLKFATTLAVLLAAVTAVSAAPSLTYTTTDLGGGLFAYDFWVNGNDAKQASFTTTLYFLADAGATINQMKVFGVVNVDKAQDATAYDGNSVVPPAYSKAKDTWVYQPFCDNAIPGTSPVDGSTINGITEGANWYMFSLATGANSAYESLQVAHIVAGGLASGTWKGTIARDSVLYQTTGAYPEPATLSLLALGALGLIRRR